MPKREITHITEALARDGYVTIPVASGILGRNERTIRSWVRERRVKTVVRQGIRYVAITEAAVLSRDTPRRDRARELTGSIPGP